MWSPWVGTVGVMQRSLLSQLQNCLKLQQEGREKELGVASWVWQQGKSWATEWFPWKASLHVLVHLLRLGQCWCQHCRWAATPWPWIFCDVNLSLSGCEILRMCFYWRTVIWEMMRNALAVKDRPYKTKECQRSPNHPFALKGAVDSMESASGAAKAGRRAYEAEIEVERLNLWTPVVTGGDRWCITWCMVVAESSEYLSDLSVPINTYKIL